MIATRHHWRNAFVLVLGIFLVPASSGAQKQPRSTPFQELWELLDGARAYRTGFVEPRTDPGQVGRIRAAGNFGVREMRINYLDPTFVGGTASPRATLLALLGRAPDGQPLAGDSFAARLEQGGSIGFQKEAAQGYQEALGEFVAGETLIANESLLQGLRTRYRVESSTDPEDESQLGLLTQSRDAFLTALRIAGDEARRNGDALRASGLAAFQFQFFVENTPPTNPGIGELVEAEFYRLTDLVNRYGIAHNALAKRKFFFGNDSQESRDEAAAEFKSAAQNTYLSSVLLAAAQSETDFQNNNGGELDRQITIAQQFYDDILSGFNPLTLLGDFVPAQSTNGLFDLLELQIQDAVCAENRALDLQRRYDEDLTELRAELLSQTEAYIDQVDILLGLEPPFDGPGSSCAPPDELVCDLSKPADRDAILALADDTAGQASIDYLQGCDDTICNNYRAWQAANIELEAAQQAQAAVLEQMQIEEERAGEVTRIISDGALRVGALELAAGIAEGGIPDISSEGVVTFKPGVAVAAALEFGASQLQAATEVRLQQTESAAILKNLLLEVVAQEINKRRAALAVTEARARYTDSIGDLRRFLRNYATATGNFEDAYFTNPAYQVALDRAIQNADASFEAAIVTAYKATKALEYEWAERLLNPVLDPNGQDRPIGDASLYNDILSAESAFKVRSAGNSALPEPSLQTYAQALQAWDSTMREVRGPLRQEGQTRLVQLRRDVFGFDSPDLAFNRLAFRSHLAANRVPGFNPFKDDLRLEFPLQILDQRLFPAVPNLKIQNLSLDLRALPGREVLVPPSPNSPLVNVIHDDQAFLRTFFADFPEDDDFLTVDLEGSRSFRQSQFFAQVEATVDGGGSAAPNTQLARRSPAVSRWSLDFEMDNGVNRDLVIENLDDIWLRITYAFGQPVEFDFPDILPCPN